MVDLRLHNTHVDQVFPEVYLDSEGHPVVACCREPAVLLLLGVLHELVLPLQLWIPLVIRKRTGSAQLGHWPILGINKRIS